jgi:hypothetical protein
MKKRGIELALLIIAVGLLLYLTCIKDVSTRYSDYMGSVDDIEIIKNSHTKAENGLLESLVFNDQKLTLDTSCNTWYYSLKEQSISAYNPNVRYKADANVKLIIEPIEITDDVIADNCSIWIIAYNGMTYSEYSLKCTILPIMEIESEGDISEENTKVSMRLYDNRSNATQQVIVSEGTMHIRGGTSRSFAKTSFKLSLTKESVGNNTRTNQISLLGMRQDDDWILYSPYNDQEKVRNVFSTNLWKYSCAQDNSLGLDNGNEYKYIELFLNGQYYGLYALGYPIDGKQLKINENNSITQNEYMYKKLYWDAENEADYSVIDEFSGYEIKVGEINDETWKPLKEYDEMLYVNSQTTIEEIYASSDIDTAIDVYLFFNLIQGVDNVNYNQMHNMYVSAKIKNGKYVFIYTPWDMDQSWGNIWNDEMLNFCEPYGITSDRNVIMESGCVDALIKRGDESIIKKIVERYEYLRKNEWSEDAINDMLDEYEEDIYASGAYLREQDRWEDGTYSNSDVGLSTFRQYVMERLSYMDEYCRQLSTAMQ